MHIYHSNLLVTWCPSFPAPPLKQNSFLKKHTHSHMHAFQMQKCVLCKEALIPGI